MARHLWRRTFVWAVLYLLVFGRGAAIAESPLGRRIKGLELQDYRGKAFSLEELTDKPIVVVAFLGTECPLAKLYAGRLRTLADEYAAHGVAFVGVNSNVQDSMTELGAFVRRHEIRFPVLKDPGNKVADQFGAERTPEVFVLDRDRAIQYRGRIDDQYLVGIVRDAPTRADLREALGELLAGRAVSVPETEAVGCLIGRAREPKTDSPVTYSNQIARLFNERCVECHRRGEIAPFALTSYEEAAGWGEMIDEVAQERRMPPWHAAPEHGRFANARRLSDDERQLIHTWVANGCPEGNPADLPPPARFTTGWQLRREPDVVYAMSKTPFVVPAEAGKSGVKYQYFEMDPGFEEDKWVDGMEVQPGNRAVVHHIIVYARPEGSRNRREWVFLTAYVPGLRLDAYPEGAAKRIPAGSRLLFEVHYTPIGIKQEDVSQVGFIFADPEKVTREVVTSEVANARFRIPPHDARHEITARSAPAPASLTLLSMSPHMHLRGKSFRYEAVFPDGGRETLLDVPRYDFNWQTRYVLTEAREFPPGTRMECTAVFDNSGGNLANPDPNATVTWGDQSWDEMMIGYFDVLVPRDDSRRAGQRPLRTAVLNADQLLRDLDKDGDGQISREEAARNAVLALAFDRVDTDRNGSIDKPELDAALTRLRKQLGE